MWKLVIIQSAMLNSYGGKMNLFVQPSNGLRVLLVETELSTARIEVVPTQQTFLPSALALLTISQASCLIISSSESILCLDKSSTSTGLNVPKPMCKVTLAKFSPFISSLFNKCLEKCNPAVGAATAPSSVA